MREVPIKIRATFSFLVAFSYCVLVFLSSSSPPLENLHTALPHPVLFHLGDLAYLLGLPLFLITFFSNKLFSDEKWGKDVAYIFAYSLIPFPVISWLGGSLNSFYFIMLIVLVFFFGWTRGYFRTFIMPAWMEDQDMPSEAKLQLLREKAKDLRGGIFLLLGLVGGGSFVSIFGNHTPLSREDAGMLTVLFVMTLTLMFMGMQHQAAFFEHKALELYKQKEKNENLLRLKIEELHRYTMQEKEAKQKRINNQRSGEF
jgi:hypothetical protein